MASIAANATSYTDNGLASNTVHHYRLRASLPAYRTSMSNMDVALTRPAASVPVTVGTALFSDNFESHPVGSPPASPWSVTAANPGESANVVAGEESRFSTGADSVRMVDTNFSTGSGPVLSRAFTTTTQPLRVRFDLRVNDPSGNVVFTIGGNKGSTVTNGMFLYLDRGE